MPPRKSATEGAASDAANPPVDAQDTQALPAKPAAAPADAPPVRRVSGGLIAAGVGSAALVAALLFVTKAKRNDWSK